MGRVEGKAGNVPVPSRVGRLESSLKVAAATDGWHHDTVQSVKMKDRVEWRKRDDDRIIVQRSVQHWIKVQLSMHAITSQPRTLPSWSRRSTYRLAYSTKKRR